MLPVWQLGKDVSVEAAALPEPEEAKGPTISELTPGRTWVEFPRVGKALDIPAGSDPTKLKFP